MNLKLKILLGFIVAILTVGGIGYFGIFKAKNKPQSPVNTAPKIEEIDTSDWQTYHNETLGFEIKIPKEWIANPYNDTKRIYFLGFMPEQDILVKPSFNIEQKISNKSLEKFSEEIFGSYPQILKEEFRIGHLDAIRVIRDFRNQVEPGEINAYMTVQELVVVAKNNNQFYILEFLADPENIDTSLALWHAILATFKPLEK